MTVDPDVMETGQAYAYTGDDPVNGVDPSGLSCAGTEGFLNALPLAGSVCDSVRGARHQIARVAQDASNAFGVASVAGQLVDVAGALALPEDLPGEAVVGAFSAVTGDFSAGLELIGCGFDKTSNCTPTNQYLDYVTLLFAATPLSLIPADIRRINDFIQLRIWLKDHPINIGTTAFIRDRVCETIGK